jgi:hypothetical protein
VPALLLVPILLGGCEQDASQMNTPPAPCNKLPAHLVNAQPALDVDRGALRSARNGRHATSHQLRLQHERSAKAASARDFVAATHLGMHVCVRVAARTLEELQQHHLCFWGGLPGLALPTKQGRQREGAGGWSHA